MKKQLIFLSLISVSLILLGQGKVMKNLEVETYKLSNGLTVFLNEDHTSPNVMGAVVVKGGAQRDPSDATGIAHYFEHIMFKGTNKIGTIDYKKEKVYLDSIKLKYDELANIEDKDQQKKIQQEINTLSLKAAEYAIPNEFDKVISSIGGTGLNAYTSWENIVYYNQFPAEQIEKWLEIYCHRFENPVFRLFQSELETVYEEKNMSMDDFTYSFFQNYMKSFYKKSPYGQQTILGKIEHLKKPSLSKMEEYFNTYYVANNMALILSGDINPSEVKPMIEKRFGKWRTGEIPPMPEFKEEAFKGREFHRVRQTPIKVGFIGYRGIPKNHPDEDALELCTSVLYNGATGLLDELHNNDKLFMADVMTESYEHTGGIHLLFVPKIIGQSLKSAEKVVLEEIEKLKSGNFDEDLIKAAKINAKKSHYRNLENYRWRLYGIIDAYMQGTSWEEYLDKPNKIDKISKEDIVNVANKYFTDNRLVFYSKMGFPKKEKLDKPDFKPIEAKNSEKKSDFAQHIDDMESKETKPKFIEFGDDVKYEDLRSKVHYYYSENKINEVFSLYLRFGYGTYHEPALEQAANYISYLGTDSLSYEEFMQKLKNIGTSFYVYPSKDYFNINISGLDENFEESLILMNEFLNNMKGDEKQLKKNVRMARLEKMFSKKEIWTKDNAIRQYAMYKENSPELKKLTIKQTKKLSSDSLLSLIKKALGYELEIHYCGTLNYLEARKAIKTRLKFAEDLEKTTAPNYQDKVKYDKPIVYFLNDKKAIQSHINFFVPGEVNNEIERRMAYPFNKYFGSGMASLIFQNVRELNSMAYSAYGYYSTTWIKDKPGYFHAKLSTQADKTNDAIALVDSLIKDMPEKPERMDIIKKAMLKSINAYYPSFRYISYSVASYLKQGYTDDPKKERLKTYENISFDDIVKFYKNNIHGKPVIISIVGDKKRIDLDALKKYGELIELKEKDIFNE